MKKAKLEEPKIIQIMPVPPGLYTAVYKGDSVDGDFTEPVDAFALVEDYLSPDEPFRYVAPLCLDMHEGLVLCEAASNFHVLVRSEE